ncbi:hypothetical protein [Gordonia sp. YC-JH1]|uniref:hypothetical protein n=1 Tax=Gordonia sp. YC-JH1 TaxID=2059875 RepID=UPI001F208F04|nr:hypothetical protein [Gordonia sp. YC-JH1]
MNAAEKAELEHLRRKLSRLSGQSGARAGTASGVVSSGVIAVPESVASLFPKRGLPRGSVAAVSGASVVPMSIIAEASRTGATVALVGLPRLNLAAAVEMGADLSRIAVVAEPGADRLEVAGVLLDGMDLVVLGFEDRLGPTGSSVAPARARVLGAGRGSSRPRCWSSVTGRGRPRVCRGECGSTGICRYGEADTAASGVFGWKFRCRRRGLAQ